MTRRRAEHRLAEVLGSLRPGQWLDVGCSGGAFLERARDAEPRSSPGALRLGDSPHRTHGEAHHARVRTGSAWRPQPHLEEAPRAVHPDGTAPAPAGGPVPSPPCPRMALVPRPRPSPAAWRQPPERLGFRPHDDPGARFLWSLSTRIGCRRALIAGPLETEASPPKGTILGHLPGEASQRDHLTCSPAAEG